MSQISLSMEIREAVSPEDIAAVRLLWREYWDSMRFDECFQGFAEELGGLPGEYRPILLAWVDGAAAGTVALRPCSGQCEMKRIFVRPEYRGQGIAKALLEQLIDAARSQGHRTMFMDTMPALTVAIAMYRARGFVDCKPYTDHPTAGAVHLRLDL